MTTAHFEKKSLAAILVMLGSGHSSPDVEISIELISDFLKKYFIYLLIFRERARKTQRGRKTSVYKRYVNWLPLAHLQPGIWPETQVNFPTFWFAGCPTY